MRTTILVGNPKPASRTRKVAEAVTSSLSLSDTDVTVIDLADHADALFQWPSQQIDELAAEVVASDLLVVASPTYKATYTGLLKAFLDRYDSDALAGVTAVPVMTGASAAHSMAPEVCLRPLLVELGAVVPCRALYFITQQMDRMDELVSAWEANNAAPIKASLLANYGGTR